MGNGQLWPGVARCGQTWPDVARYGQPWPGQVWPDVARCGKPPCSFRAVPLQVSGNSFPRPAVLFVSFCSLGPPYFSHFGHLGALFTVSGRGHQKKGPKKSSTDLFGVLLEDPFSRLFSIFCVLCGSLRGMNSGTGSRSVFRWILDDFGELLGGFLDHFSGRSAKTKKCVWTAQA